MSAPTTERPAPADAAEGAALSTRMRRLWHQFTDGPLYHLSLIHI